ncbi:MAG: M28 family peptidase, partial [Bacteroidota bacterium]
MKTLLLSFFCLSTALGAAAQANMFITNPAAEQVLLGNFNPNDYAPNAQLDHPDQIVQTILDGVSPDSLKSYLLQLSTFETRNTGSDTVSAVRGIGAARRWVFQKFSQFGQESGGRLLPAYFQFDQVICNVGQHRNVIAVLPGSDTSAHGIVLIEAHLDSRCDVVCDTACLAEGMEDNGSGTALVIELARVMHKLSFKNTLIFMATIGEEQGLVGAEAFAIFSKNKGIPIRAVLNNDVIGGVICGETSSPPSCPGFNQVDSTQVRLFSYGNNNSKHKQLARFNKLEYVELVKPLAAVPMLVTIMSAEDRTGRGGDHIPFREQGFAAMRFTSANEHGDASVGPNYHDRQHTSEDVLGVDTDGDQVIDSFFVDFNYLARNATINGVAAGMAAIGVHTPAFTAGKLGDSVVVEITDPLDYGEYRIFYRYSGHDFDSIFTVFQKQVTLPKPPPNTFYVSVAAVDANGTE